MTSLKVAYEGGMCGDGFSTISKAEKEQHEKYLKSTAFKLPTPPPTPPPSPTLPSVKTSWKSKLARYFCCFGWGFRVREAETKLAELEKEMKKEPKITFEEFLHEFENEEKGAQSIIDHKKHVEDRSFGTDRSYEEAKEVCKKEVDELEDAYQAALAKRGLMET